MRMMRVFRRATEIDTPPWGISLAIILLLFLAAPLSRMATAAPAQNAAPSGGLAAQPIIQQLTLAAGAELDAYVYLRNENPQRALKVQLLLADLDPSGMIRPVASTPYSLTAILTLPTQDLVMNPGETRKIALRVRGDGHGRFGALVASAFTEGPHPVPFARIIMQLVVAAPGESPEPSAQLSVTQQGVITMHIKNAGENLCQGRGALFLLRPDGSFLGRLDIPEFAILPGGATTLTMRWPETLKSGTVAKAALAIDGRGTPFVASSQSP